MREHAIMEKEIGTGIISVDWKSIPISLGSLIAVLVFLWKVFKPISKTDFKLFEAEMAKRLDTIKVHLKYKDKEVEAIKANQEKLEQELKENSKEVNRKIDELIKMSK